MKESLSSKLARYVPINVHDGLSVYAYVHKRYMTKKIAPAHHWNKSVCPYCGTPSNGKQVNYQGLMWIEYQCGAKISTKGDFIVGASAPTSLCAAYGETNGVIDDVI